MDVLIIGENRINGQISDYFTSRGMDVSSVSDVCSLRGLSGEFGNFTAHMRDCADIESDFVVFTEQPAAGALEIGGLPVMSLYDEPASCASASPVSANASKEPVLFLLDYFCESPFSAAACALSNAARLARGKRQVFYLAKFIRTAGRHTEVLYKKAREAGVTFVKYEDLQVAADLVAGEFTFSVSDGSFKFDIVTKTVYADGGRNVGERFAYALKKLNLTPNKYGHLTDDTYYLTPVLTSRRGVFHLTRNLLAAGIDEGLRYIYAAVMGGTASGSVLDVPSHGVAEIDSKKCVFCYNCYRACPHAALEPDSNVCQMRCLSGACFGCGICVGVCPASAINLDEGMSSDKEAILNGGSAKSALVICCENSGAAVVEASCLGSGGVYDGLEVLVVPCGGMIDMDGLLGGLESFSKVMAVACPDDACRHFDGSRRACAQVSRLRDFLTAAGLSADKVRFAQISQAMPKILHEELCAFLD